MVAEPIQHEEDTFRHEAFFYASEAGFVDGTSAFIREGLNNDEAILVVLSDRKIQMLRDQLGSAADGVVFADMADVGRNPARIIPAWLDFIGARRPGSNARGIGEPIWAERGPDEMVECQRHEALLNLAFAEHPDPFWLLCPYDANALSADVMDEALRTHPMFNVAGVSRRSDRFTGLKAIARPFDKALSTPPVEAMEYAFGGPQLSELRSIVARRAQVHGLPSERVADLVLAVNEIATNSIRYGGGGGLLNLWNDNGSLLCQVRDRGLIDQPLVGRERPQPTQEGGYGMWLVHQLCDLVQVRTSPAGSTIRLRMTK